MFSHIIHTIKLQQGFIIQKCSLLKTLRQHTIRFRRLQGVLGWVPTHADGVAWPWNRLLCITHITLSLKWSLNTDVCFVFCLQIDLEREVSYSGPELSKTFFPSFLFIFILIYMHLYMHILSIYFLIPLNTWWDVCQIWSREGTWQSRQKRGKVLLLILNQTQPLPVPWAQLGSALALYGHGICMKAALVLMDQGAKNPKTFTLNISFLTVFLLFARKHDDSSNM